VLLEDVAQGLLLAELLAERRDVDGAGGGVHSDGFMRGEAEIEGDVPIESAVEEDELAEFVFLGQEVALLGAAQFQLTAEEPFAREVGLRHRGKLLRAEFNECSCFFLAYACDIAEIAEEVIDVADLHFPSCFKGKNSPSFLG
jgi:hypothetical protein